MLITIVTVTFNNHEDLVATLESVRGVGGIESVVINGGDCPKTLEYLEMNSSWVRSISEPDEGISDAFNKGIQASHGEAIVFLNSGDLLLNRDFFRWASDVLDENNGLDFVHGDVVYLDTIAGPIRKAPALCSLGRGFPYYHQTMVVRKSTYEKIGLFDKEFRLAMDFEWVCRFGREGPRVLYYDGSPVVRMDGGGVSNVHEIDSIKEGHRALRQHCQMTFENGWGLAKRYGSYCLRTLLLRLGARGVLAYSKQWNSRGRIA